MKKVYFGELEFLVLDGVYEPAEDTYFLARELDVKEGEEVLELGTGCGLLAVLAAKAGGRVVATDVNPKAIECARMNAERHGVKLDLRQGDLWEPVGGGKFDLIIFNPPYLPCEGEDPSWCGGPDGRRVIDPFLVGLPSHLRPGGRCIFVQSSLARVEDTCRHLQQLGLRFELKRRKIAWEELVLFRVTLPPK